jgi:voltage-gated potassium channel
MMKSALRSRLFKSVAAAVVLFGVSVLGYMWIEKFSPLEAVYMTIITLSTVGFGEVHPLTLTGQVFTVLIIVIGVIIIAVLFGTLTEYIVAGELAGTLKMRRIMRKIRTMKDHYIVCGFSKVGEHVAVELQNQGLSCVVIDKDKESIERCEYLSLTVIQGDATMDDTLRQAGIAKAKGLVAALKSDADNVYVILSARTLNPDLTIVGRSTGEETSVKLKMAGADQAVSPYDMAGYRIVNQLTRPHVTYFLDIAMRHKGLNLLMDEIQIAPGSPLVSQKMNDAEVRTRTGATILSILRGADHEVLDWSPELEFEPEDMLIVVGMPDELQALAELAKNPRFLNTNY